MENIKIKDTQPISADEIEKCISILEQLVTDTDQIFDIPKERRTALIKIAGMFSRPSREEFSRRKKDGKKAIKRKMAARDKHARKETGIRSARESVVFVAPKLLNAADLTNKKVLELESPRNCYVCKDSFTKLHHFYDTMCTECGDFNYAKRFQTADVKGQIAVITGSRLKIGYHITLM
ncbi:MAG: oxidoreductase, partial [Lutibacter sp.]